MFEYLNGVNLPNLTDQADERKCESIPTSRYRMVTMFGVTMR